ncbi:hypothetical protein KUCAC02_007663, partial [Chaenocephalus aceratus]
MRKASRHPTLSSMANSGCLLLSGSGMLPHSLQCPPAFLYLPEPYFHPSNPLTLPFVGGKKKEQSSAGAAARLREMTAREQKGNRLRGRLSPPHGGAGSILPQDDVTFLLPSIRMVVPLFALILPPKAQLFTGTLDIEGF